MVKYLTVHFNVQKGNLEFSRLQLTLRKSTKSGTIDIDQLGLNWDTRLHLAVLQVIEEWKTFQNRFNQFKPVKIPTVKDSEHETKQSWAIALKHKTSICAVLSPTHTIQFQAGNSNSGHDILKVVCLQNI